MAEEIIRQLQEEIRLLREEMSQLKAQGEKPSPGEKSEKDPEEGSPKLGSGGQEGQSENSGTRKDQAESSRDTQRAKKIAKNRRLSFVIPPDIDDEGDESAEDGASRSGQQNALVSCWLHFFFSLLNQKNLS